MENAGRPIFEGLLPEIDQNIEEPMDIEDLERWVGVEPTNKFGDNGEGNLVVESNTKEITVQFFAQTRNEASHLVQEFDGSQVDETSSFVTLGNYRKYSYLFFLQK